VDCVEVHVRERAFDVAREIDAIVERAPGAGAVASFIGRVRRDMAEAEAGIEWLELEHYPGMTEESIRRIAGQAIRRFDLLALTVIHRVGRLLPGEPIVLVLTASRHRRAAFDACEFVMDYLKLEAIFWKKEKRDGDVVWIESTDADRARGRAWKD
jgi:molybdopterin synthase catalytic subunit